MFRLFGSEVYAASYVPTSTSSDMTGNRRFAPSQMTKSGRAEITGKS